jgi:hypothetical protein
VPGTSLAVRASPAELQPFEDRLDALDGAHGSALKRLLRTPMPDPSLSRSACSAGSRRTLALKIELIVDEEAATLAGGERCLAALKADGWRLASA